jgi:hypothetical protein
VHQEKFMESIARPHVSRAQRFPMHIPLHYRLSGMPDWRDARTINISRTGILIHGDETLQPDTKLDIRLDFPFKATISCQGSIVRSEEQAFAVRIHRYRLHRI